MTPAVRRLHEAVADVGGEPAAVGVGSADRISVRLASLDAYHADAFARLVVDRSLRDIPVGRLAQQSGPAAVFAAQRAAVDAGRAAWFAVMDADAGFVGQVGLVARTGTQAQLSYWIGAAFRGRGRATMAACDAVARAFDDGGLVRLLTFVAPGNLASRRVLARNSFTPVSWRVGDTDLMAFERSASRATSTGERRDDGDR